MISIKTLCFLSCGGKQGNKKIMTEKNIVTQIEIKRVDFGILTIAHVDCSEYEYRFNSEIENYMIENQNIINQWMNIINTLQKDTVKYDFDNEPDVRAKLLIYHKNKSIDTLCMDNGRIMLNGELCIFDKKLMEKIENL
jgi:hypothetical protein